VISTRRRSKKALLPSHGIDRWFDPSIAHSEKAAYARMLSRSITGNRISY